MIEKVEYKECTCDICGKKESIGLSVDLPKNWGWFRVYTSRIITDYHTCETCGLRVKDALDRLKEGVSK